MKNDKKSTYTFNPNTKLLSKYNNGVISSTCNPYLFIIVFLTIFCSTNSTSAFFCPPIETITLETGKTTEYNIEGDGVSVGSFEVGLVDDPNVVQISPPFIGAVKGSKF